MNSLFVRQSYIKSSPETPAEPQRISHRAASTPGVTS